MADFEKKRARWLGKALARRNKLRRESWQRHAEPIHPPLEIEPMVGVLRLRAQRIETQCPAEARALYVAAAVLEAHRLHIPAFWWDPSYLDS